MVALHDILSRLQDHLNAQGLPKGFPGSQQPGAAPSTARSVLTSTSLSGSSSCEDPSGTLHSRFITPLTSKPKHPVESRPYSCWLLHRAFPPSPWAPKTFIAAITNLPACQCSCPSWQLGRKEGRKITHPWQPTRLNGWNSVCAWRLGLVSPTVSVAMLCC